MNAKAGIFIFYIIKSKVAGHTWQKQDFNQRHVGNRLYKEINYEGKGMVLYLYNNEKVLNEAFRENS